MKKKLTIIARSDWRLRNGYAVRLVTYSDGSRSSERMPADSLMALASVIDDSGSNETRVSPANSRTDGEAWAKLAEWG